MRWDNSWNKNVVGRKVLKANVIDDFSVALDLDDGNKVTVKVIGECCSYSYYTDPNQFAELEGSVILRVEERSGETEADGGTYTQWEFLVFTTNKGHVTIDWRNESNGYYSGWIELYVDDSESSRIDGYPTGPELADPRGVTAMMHLHDIVDSVMDPVCYCGSYVRDHGYHDNHSPVESDEYRYLANRAWEWLGGKRATSLDGQPSTRELIAREIEQYGEEFPSELVSLGSIDFVRSIVFGVANYVRDNG